MIIPWKEGRVVQRESFEKGGVPPFLVGRHLVGNSKVPRTDAALSGGMEEQS